jgi:hypothetical protein
MSNFGYRALGFGSFPNRAAAAVDGAFTWSTTLTLGSTNNKSDVYEYGYSTSTIHNSASIGSLSDTTIDDMWDSADGSSQAVTLTNVTWLVDDTTRSAYTISTVRIKFSPTDQHSGTNGVTWDSVTINGTKFEFTGTSGDDPWAYNRAVGALNPSSPADYSYPSGAYASSDTNVTNPFGTTSTGGTYTITFESSGF